MISVLRRNGPSYQDRISLEFSLTLEQINVCMQDLILNDAQSGP